jgi:biopolymer transport protein ExbD
MASSRGILARRGRRKINGAFELQLTSMMDVLVIIVVFLLKSYNTSLNNFSTAPGLQLPISSSPDTPNDSVQVVITPESLTVENERILDLIQTAGSVDTNDAKYAFKPTDLDEGGRRIVPLYDALMKAREKTELLLAKSKARVDGKPLEFEGILAIQADKRVKYETVRKIMYTAAAAGYKVFRFLAMKRDA